MKFFNKFLKKKDQGKDLVNKFFYLTTDIEDCVPKNWHIVYSSENNLWQAYKESEKTAKVFSTRPDAIIFAIKSEGLYK